MAVHVRQFALFRRPGAILVQAVLAYGLVLLAAAAQGAAPFSRDATVSDMTAWMRPLNEKAPPAPGAQKAWLALDLSNPVRDELHRIVTLERKGPGFDLFGRAEKLTLMDVMLDGEGVASLIDVAGSRAAEIRLKPLSNAKIAFYAEGPVDYAAWRIWKPAALAAAEQRRTLFTGLTAGAALVMAAWLAGLATFRLSAEPAWAAVGVAALVTLILGGSVLPLPAPASVLASALMVAAAVRYVVTYLYLDHTRPRIAILFDGLVFALVAIALAQVLGVPEFAPVLPVLALASLSLAALQAIAESFRKGARARALLPGIALTVTALAWPWLVPAGPEDIPMLAETLLTAGALALAFAATAPHEPELNEREVEALASEQRKAREAEYRYALGLAAAHQGLWDWNFETDTLFMSPSAEALLGLEAGAVGGSERKWAELILPEDVQLYADAINAHRRQGNSSFTLEMRMRHAKGGSRWLQLRASCIADPKGRAVRCIGLLSDITGRKAQEQRAGGESVDPVTGLMLRNAFIDRLDAVLASMRTARVRRHGAVLAVDVDRLRIVADSMGHDAGDLFLSQVARRLDHAAGPDDAVARLGSDEFAVLALGSAGDEDGALVAARIREALVQPVAINDREIYPAASIGLALVEPGHRYAGDVLREAEIAMYHAKRGGRGGFEIYQPQMKPRSAERLILDTDLRTALEREQIEIHYQPIVRLEDASIAGFEALMRWRHPQRGLLSPGDFIALAEETGLIVPLGRYAVEKAVGELKRWQTYFQTAEPLFCSVNVSARQLFRKEFFDDAIEILGRHKPARLSLKLELTESVIMQDPDSTATTLSRLKEAGAGLALDDFGTGFSSLAYLQRFPFDTVKIDRSFVADMARNEETPVVLCSIVRLAHDLDMSVVAEGVETQGEASRLKSLGCEFAQGYLFGAPVDAAAAYNAVALKMRAGAGAQQSRPPPSSPARIPR